MIGNVLIGRTVIGSCVGSVSMRVLHVSRGRPFTSAEHEPHFPALQFQRTARSGERSLNVVQRIENDHAGRDRHFVIHGLAAILVPRNTFRIASAIYRSPSRTLRYLVRPSATPIARRIAASQRGGISAPFNFHRVIFVGPMNGEIFVIASPCGTFTTKSISARSLSQTDRVQNSRVKIFARIA